MAEFQGFDIAVTIQPVADGRYRVSTRTTAVDDRAQACFAHFKINAAGSTTIYEIERAPFAADPHREAETFAMGAAGQLITWMLATFAEETAGVKRDVRFPQDREKTDPSGY